MQTEHTPGGVAEPFLSVRISEALAPVVGMDSPHGGGRSCSMPRRNFQPEKAKIADFDLERKDIEGK
jgi:hypothetical protein